MYTTTKTLEEKVSHLHSKSLKLWETHKMYKKLYMTQLRLHKTLQYEIDELTKVKAQVSDEELEASKKALKMAYLFLKTDMEIHESYENP